MAIIRKVFRHSNGPCVVLPVEVRSHLGVVLGDYVAWRLLEGGEVRLVSLEEEFRAGRLGKGGASGFAVSPGQSASSLRRGG